MTCRFRDTHLFGVHSFRPVSTAVFHDDAVNRRPPHGAGLDVSDGTGYPSSLHVLNVVIIDWVHLCHQTIDKLQMRRTHLWDLRIQVVPGTAALRLRHDVMSWEGRGGGKLDTGRDAGFVFQSQTEAV